MQILNVPKRDVALISIEEIENITLQNKCKENEDDLWEACRVKGKGDLILWENGTFDISVGNNIDNGRWGSSQQNYTLMFD